MGRIKLNRVMFPPYKVDLETNAKIQKIAISMGFKYGSTAATGEFLDMIGDLDPDLLALIAQKSKLTKGAARSTTIE